MSSKQQREKVTLKTIDHAEEKTDDMKWSLTKWDIWERQSLTWEIKHCKRKKEQKGKLCAIVLQWQQRLHHRMCKMHIGEKMSDGHPWGKKLRARPPVHTSFSIGTNLWGTYQERKHLAKMLFAHNKNQNTKNTITQQLPWEEIIIHQKQEES